MKSIYCLIIIGLLSIKLSAQNPWLNTFGFNQGYSTCVIASRDSNIVVGGKYMSDSAQYYPRLMKLDLSGHVIWDKQFTELPCTENSYLYDVVECADGSFLCAISGCTSTYTITRVDANGNITGYTNTPYRILNWRAYDNGKVKALVYSSIAAGSQNWLIDIALDNTVTATKWLNGLAPFSQVSYACFNDDESAVISGYDLDSSLLIKINVDTSIAWRAAFIAYPLAFGFGPGYNAGAVIQDKFGNYCVNSFLRGWSPSFHNIPVSFLSKISSDGVFIGNYPGPLNFMTGGVDFAKDCEGSIYILSNYPDDGIYTIDSSEVSVFDIATNIPLSGYSKLAILPDGSKVISGTGLCSSGSPSPCTKFAVERTASSAPCGTNTLINEPSATFTRDYVSISPNPTNDVLNITLGDYAHTTGRLLSLNGSVVREVSFNSATSTLALGDLPNGMYILQCFLSNTVSAIKVIVQH